MAFHRKTNVSIMTEKKVERSQEAMFLRKQEFWANKEGNVEFNGRPG